MTTTVKSTWTGFTLLWCVLVASMGILSLLNGAEPTGWQEMIMLLFMIYSFVGLVVWVGRRILTRKRPSPNTAVVWVVVTCFGVAYAFILIYNGFHGMIMHHYSR